MCGSLQCASKSANATMMLSSNLTQRSARTVCLSCWRRLPQSASVSRGQLRLRAVVTLLHAVALRRHVCALLHVKTRPLTLRVNVMAFWRSLTTRHQTAAAQLNQLQHTHLNTAFLRARSKCHNSAKPLPLHAPFPPCFDLCDCCSCQILEAC